MRRQGGFTFLEILFLIGIGVLLMVIMLPVFSAAKKKGRKAQCISNLRQVGFALQLYAQDNDELMPPWMNRKRSGDGETSAYDDPEALSQSLAYKVREPGVFFCGSDLYAGDDIEVFGINHKYSSYFYNFKPPGSRDGTVMIGGVYKGGALAIPPADYPLVRDANNSETTETVKGQRAIGCRHLGTVNVLYLDWHADSVRVASPDRS